MSSNPVNSSIPERTLRTTFIWLSHRKALGRLSTRVPITRPMVRRFIAGESLEEVLPALEALRDGGYLTTVDVLGESVGTADACGAAAGRYEETLDALATDDPGFAETHLFLGEQALGNLTLRTAEKHLAEAVKAMPDLPPAWLLLGHVHLAIEEPDLARDAYHRVNIAVPGQREAMLGEARSLSYLGRHGEAIAILDEVERLGTWYMGDMYYWRAWNRHRLTEHDAANDDVLASRQRMPMDPKVDSLAGFIALARHEVARAEGEFRLAVQHYEGRGERDCDSGYYLASTLVMQRKWAEAAPFFERAEPCYALDEKAVRQRIATIRASDLPDDRQDRLVAAKERDILKVQLQQARSCYNAAVAHANLGEPGKARPFAQRALAHPEMKSLAEQLLARLGPS
jgi:tetratricopeptide (TPR) repeat protein